MTTATQSDLNPSSPTGLAALRERLVGRLLLPTDDGYDDARKVANNTIDRRPAAIVRAAVAQDVAEAVRFVRNSGLALAVRSGGHSVATYSMIEGALVIDLSEMKAVSIDPIRQIARVSAGATSRDVAGPAHAYGLALSTGDTASVGIAGLTLGGGIGWMVRKYGLTIDNLLAVQLVTANGDLITASAEQHQELFWALRGGGGNFGIVTEFTFRMAPVGAVLGGPIVFPATREAIRGFQEFAKTAPDELTIIATVMHAPPAPFIPEDRVGELVFMVVTCWTGDPEEGQRVLDPLRAVATPIVDAVAVMPYPVMYAFMEAAEQPHGLAIRSMFSDALSDDMIDAIIDAAGKATSPFSMIQLRGLGGAMGRVGEQETAFAHRKAGYLVAVIGLWFDPTENPVPHRAWTESLWQQLKPARLGVYSNFLADEGDARVREAYPAATYERLAKVKRQYDPTNLFRFNQNIKPAA